MQTNKCFRSSNVGLDTPVLLTKLSSISVSILYFKLEGDYVQYECTGDIPKVLLDEEMTVTDHPTNLSTAFS